MGKQTSTKEVTIRKVPLPLGGLRGHETDKAIERWIKDISDLHRSKPPPSVLYSKPMPDIDSLMQEWPLAVENILRGHDSGRRDGLPGNSVPSSEANYGLPTADFECDILTFVDLVCGVCDIPIYKSRIQSLHVLFMLYSAFKHSHHDFGGCGSLTHTLEKKRAAPGHSQLLRDL